MTGEEEEQRTVLSKAQKTKRHQRGIHSERLKGYVRTFLGPKNKPHFSVNKRNLYICWKQNIQLQKKDKKCASNV